MEGGRLGQLARSVTKRLSRSALNFSDQGMTAKPHKLVPTHIPPSQMSSEEDWSIILSLSDLDDEQVETQGNPHNNVSSIATLKLPVLGDAARGQGDAEEAQVAFAGAQGATGAQATEAAEAAFAAIEAAKPAEAATAARFAAVAAATPRPALASSSRTKDLIQQYEAIALGLRSGLATGYRRLRGHPETTPKSESVSKRAWPRASSISVCAAVPPATRPRVGSVAVAVLLFVAVIAVLAVPLGRLVPPPPSLWHRIVGEPVAPTMAERLKQLWQPVPPPTPFESVSRQLTAARRQWQATIGAGCHHAAQWAAWWQPAADAAARRAGEAAHTSGEAAALIASSVSQIARCLERDAATWLHKQAIPQAAKLSAQGQQWARLVGQRSAQWGGARMKAALGAALGGAAAALGDIGGASHRLLTESAAVSYHLRTWLILIWLT